MPSGLKPAPPSKTSSGAAKPKPIADNPPEPGALALPGFRLSDHPTQPREPRTMFGLFAAVPETVADAWGARLIYPDDLLHDRQGWKGEASPELVAWLNGKSGAAGALHLALKNARKLDQARPMRLSRDGRQMVTLYRDDLGVIVASPQGSHGYLYAAGWLHNGDQARQPGAEFDDQA